MIFVRSERLFYHYLVENIEMQVMHLHSYHVVQFLLTFDLLRFNQMQNVQYKFLNYFHADFVGNYA